MFKEKQQNTHAINPITHKANIYLTVSPRYAPLCLVQCRGTAVRRYFGNSSVVLKGKRAFGGTKFLQKK